MSELAGDRDHYIAGLWRSELPRTLMWSPINSSRVRKIAPYHAPSWSWASIRCDSLHLPQDSHNGLGTRCPVLEVLDVSTVPTNIPFGPVLDGSIRVRGALAKGYIVGSQRRQPWSKDMGCYLDLEPNIAELFVLEDNTIELTTLEEKKQTNQKRDKEVFYCIQVMAYLEFHSPMIDGLLLYPNRS
jgi:hypothetical protein